jgi:hypothetical protein
MGYEAWDCDHGVTVLRRQLQVMTGAFLRLADRLADAPDAGIEERVSDEALREAALTCLARWQDDLTEDGNRRPAAIAVVAAGEWIEQMGRLLADLERPVAQAVKAAHVPWWR